MKCVHTDAFFRWPVGFSYLYWCRRCGAIALAGSTIDSTTVFTEPNKDNPPIELKETPP